MSEARLSIALAAIAFVAGCAKYSPQPLDRALMLEELKSASPEQAVKRTDGGAAGLQIDLADGLSEAEVVGVALTLNAGLRAKRLEVGEADSLLVAAGAWPNPELGVSAADGIGGASGYTLGADLLFDLLAIRERGPAKRAAQAQIEATRADVLSEEMKLAREVRRQWLEVLAKEAMAGQLGRATELRRRMAELTRDRQAAGDVTEIDRSAAELEWRQAEREERNARREVIVARNELNRLLGLPAAYDLRLSDISKPLEIRSARPVSESDLEQHTYAGRLELKAREAEYERAEQELSLAVRRQFPGVAVGPTYERELEGDESLGLGASVELPLFDRNQGEIAEKRAQRDRLREEYRAALHQVRAEAAAAYAELVEAEKELAIQERELLPVVRRNQELNEGAFRAGELRVLDWLAAEAQVLEVQREYVAAAVRYRAATIDLEWALGVTPMHRAGTTTKTTTENEDEHE